MLKDDQIVWAIHQMEDEIGPVGRSLDSRTPFQYLISCDFERAGDRCFRE
ncbi:DNA-(apurinic or apyrimidinic site) lyase [Lactiplantibacillus plantarum subsp. plantarum]|uniref:DNA-(Apurinic or apyrimidinic site) lyase n=1 Tax=Lactiplantibacillus plantarum subsp. plantarum TaxID=337330 RepID=A0A2S3UAM1_LACPN|nr:DNA-(apurinic or apyrimidinic site) lyase [Lactiplantibacillus plantarum subsp. plantarum]